MPNEDALIDFVQDELARGMQLESLSLTDNLINTGILDSLGIMKLILFLEEKFSVKITDEDLIPENFESIRTINFLVEKKMAGATVLA